MEKTRVRHGDYTARLRQGVVIASVEVSAAAQLRLLKRDLLPEEFPFKPLKERKALLAAAITRALEES